MNEIELKLLLDPRQERLLRTGAAVRRASLGRARTRRLHSVYYDTADGALRRAGIALRLRRDGRRWIQTVKKSPRAIAQGLATPIEDECELERGEIDLCRIADAKLRREVIELTRLGLAPAVETSFRRTSRMLEGPAGGKVELAIDVGEVRANGRSAPLTEAELEVKEGPEHSLFALARRLITRGPVRFSNRSKAARAAALGEVGRAVEPPAPLKANPVKLEPSAGVEDAAVAVLTEIEDQIASNIVAAVETDDIEAPHQLRVGLRRLRSALGALRPAIGCAELDRLRGEARALGATVGRLRDLDVFVEAILGPAARDAPGEPGFGKLVAEMRARREATADEVRRKLSGAAVAGFVLDLAGFVATRGWRAGGRDARALRGKVQRLARNSLDRRWRALKKSARETEHLTMEERHEMRKEIKKLRYVAELFELLWPVHDVGQFRAALRSLQDDFGALNDAAMAEALLTGSGAPGADDADAQRAAGCVIGASFAEAGRLWPRAIADWRALEALGPFWR